MVNLTVNEVIALIFAGLGGSVVFAALTCLQWSKFCKWPCQYTRRCIECVLIIIYLAAVPATTLFCRQLAIDGGFVYPGTLRPLAEFYWSYYGPVGVVGVALAIRLLVNLVGMSENRFRRS